MFAIGKMHELLPKVPLVPKLKNALLFTRTEVSGHTHLGGFDSNNILYIPKSPYIFICSRYFFEMKKLSSLPEYERKFFLQKDHKKTHLTYEKNDTAQTRIQIIFNKSVPLPKEKIDAFSLLAKQREKLQLEKADLELKVQKTETELNLNQAKIKVALDIESICKE